MKSKEEKEYYAYLEKIIRQQKAQSPFWKHNTNSYEMDILVLMNHISKKNPRLIDKILNNYIDTTGMENSSKEDILAFMGKTEKGTVCKWKNENGEEIYLLNNGERFFTKKKQILVFGNHINKGDLELIKKSMYGSVLKKDIQKVYEKIAREEEIKQQRKLSGRKPSFVNTIVEKKEKIKEHTASEFERNFKLLVKEQGTLCIPRATADTMLAFMNGPEKSKLAGSLSSIGVKDSLSWERLLDKWKTEALNPEIEIEHSYKRTIKSRNVEILHSR